MNQNTDTLEVAMPTNSSIEIEVPGYTAVTHDRKNSYNIDGFLIQVGDGCIYDIRKIKETDDTRAKPYGEVPFPLRLQLCAIISLVALRKQDYKALENNLIEIEHIADVLNRLDIPEKIEGEAE